MSEKWTPKALLAYLKLKLDNDFLLQNITITGEISNFTHHNNRHMYFTLKDDSSRISCVMFQSNASKVNFQIKEGMEVILKANVSVFESSGSLQLYVSEIQEAGIGDLAKQFEILKEKLFKEGLFSDKYKKSFKKYPDSIGIISGANSAALNDILVTLKRRWPLANLVIYESLVQGKDAHLDIINKLNKADDANHDTLILARGGGSFEDLWAFNEEALARVIFDLKTPIVSGVGHEIDFTISDFVSDLRAPTPTAAAELVSPDINEVVLNVSNLKSSIYEKMLNRVNLSQQIVDTYATLPIYKHPSLLIQDYKDKLIMINKGFINYKDSSLKKINLFKQLSNNFINTINQFNRSETIRINNLNNSLINNINNLNKDIRNNFAKQLTLLDSYSPINTIKRGYSIVEVNNEIITDSKQVNIDDEINIKLHKGSIKSRVIDKE